MPTKKQILLNPGPVNTTESVRKALLRPDICHREKEFADLLSGVKTKLLSLFNIQKSHDAAFFSGSGTTALESMVASFGQRDRKTLVIANGIYGDRIESILKIYNLSYTTLRAPLGFFPSLEKIEEALKSDRSIHAVAMVHHETSTGMLNPLSDVARLTKKYKKFLLVDAISSLGGEVIDFRKTPIDLCAGTSGKCLHGFPGISFVLISKSAQKALQHNEKRSFSLDLNTSLQCSAKNETAFTPAIQILYGLDQALNELKKETLKKRIQNYNLKSLYIQNEFEKLGARVVVRHPFRSHVLTAFWLPPSLSYAKLHGHFKKNGFTIYAGQSNLAGKIFRIANLGDVSMNDLKRLVSLASRILK